MATIKITLPCYLNKTAINTEFASEGVWGCPVQVLMLTRAPPGSEAGGHT